MKRLIITSDMQARTSSELLSRRISQIGEKWTEKNTAAYQLSRKPAGLSGQRLETYARSAALAGAMASWNPGRSEFKHPSDMTIAPAIADELVATSEQIAEMTVREPALSRGRLQKDRQHWVGDGSHIPIVPRREMCVLAPEEKRRTSVPYFWSAFYTSTAMQSDYSMWRALMSRKDSDAFLRKLPWHTWEMVVDDNVRIAEVKDAVTWVDLVRTYGVVEEGMVWPDWAKMAEKFDAIHFTWPLIVAAQGFTFATEHGLIARAFWGFECVLWLQWRFTGAHLVERFDAG